MVKERYLKITYITDGLESGLCVSEETDDSINVLRMDLDKEADKLYKVLTDQSIRIKEIVRIRNDTNK